jgi:hypothetical protein
MARILAAALAGVALGMFAAAAGRHASMIPAKTEAQREALRDGKRTTTTGALAVGVALTCLGALFGPIAAGIVAGPRAAALAAGGYAAAELAALRLPLAFVPDAWRSS